MALVAATTLGLGDFEHFRAEISADSSATTRGRAYRLIVQSYAAESLEGDLPSPRARPLSSVQRAVTAEELQRGINIDLVQLERSADAAVLIAWVEQGEPDLEFDALTARPSAAEVYGVAKLDSESGSARVVLRRSVA